MQITQDALLTPDFVARATGGRPGVGAGPARDLVWDSREVCPGAAFVTLPGALRHGNEFLEEALGRGATLLITDRDHPRAVRVRDPYRALIRLGRALRNRYPGPVIGVSGSAGKTTTKEAIAQGLGFSAPEGNLNTPPALARFFLHLKPQAPGAVVELGIDRPGEMDDLLALAAPQIGVLTAIAPAHLAGLGSEEIVAREKAKLLEQSETALVEYETARRWGLKGRTYGFGEGARFRGRGLKFGPEGTRFRYGALTVHLPYPGRGPALAALAALALAEVLGRPLAPVTERLAGLKLPPGRLHYRTLGPYRVLDDAYNANPASVAAGLEVLAAFPGPRLAVLGTMLELGEAAERYHEEAARAAARVAEKLLFVGPFAEAMQKAAGRGMAAADLAAAREALAELAEPGDLVYLKASRAVGLEGLLEVLGD